MDPRHGLLLPSGPDGKEEKHPNKSYNPKSCVGIHLKVQIVALRWLTYQTAVRCARQKPISVRCKHSIPARGDGSDWPITDLRRRWIARFLRLRGSGRISLA